jgi:chaperonin GroEL (HSP60 family)
MTDSIPLLTELKVREDPALLKILKKDRTRLPLPHERIPSPDIYVRGMPVLVLDKRTGIHQRLDALTSNVAAAKCMFEFVKGLFGPKRMSKLVSEGSSAYLVSDARTILQKLKLEHPVAQLIAGAAISVSRSVGSGAATTVILAAKILEECGLLLERGVPRSTVIDGFEYALRMITQTAESLQAPMHPSEEQVMHLLAGSSLRGRLPVVYQERIVSLSLSIVRMLKPAELGSSAAWEALDFKKIPGGSIDESEVVDGMALYKEIPHPDMPRRIMNSEIAVIRGGLTSADLRNNRYGKSKLTVEDPRQVGSLCDKKKIILEGVADSILASGANVIVVEKGIDELLLDFFAERGVMAVRRFPPQELVRLTKATGATAVPLGLPIERSDLGCARIVEECKINGQPWLFIRGCEFPRSIDVVLRGTNMSLLDDIERVLKEFVIVAPTIASDSRLVWGGGAFEEEVALALRRESVKFPDKTQLVFEALANAFEHVPILLLDTCGMNALDSLLELRRRHHAGETDAGVNAITRSIESMSREGIYDCMAAKLRTITTAFEVATTVVRIDCVITAPRLSEEESYYKRRMKGTSPERLETLRKEYGLEALE